MSGWTELFTDGDASAFSVGPQTALMMLLLAFCIGHVVAWIYMWTHTGLSYSQMFTGSLLALPVIVCLVMLLVAGSITIALGLFAIIAIVRFRNVLKDTRDTVFILWAIVEGIAVGTTHYTTAIIGCVCVGAMFLYMRFTSFGGRQRYDVIVSLIWTGGLARLHELKNVLYRHSLRRSSPASATWTRTTSTCPTAWSSATPPAAANSSPSYRTRRAPRASRFTIVKTNRRSNTCKIAFPFRGGSSGGGFAIACCRS